MHRIIIVGNSLFAETLSHMFEVADHIEVITVIPRMDDLPVWVATSNPDAVLVADASEEFLDAKTCLRVRCDLPIIYTTLHDSHFTVFSSRRVRGARAELVAAIAALPKQGQ